MIQITNKHEQPNAAVRALVLGALECWSIKDWDGAVEAFAGDAVFALNVAPDLMPLGGETRGREQIRAAINASHMEWRGLVFEPYVAAVAGDRARVSVGFAYRHRASRLILTGRMRLVFEVADGLITRVDGTYDAPLVEAFVRYARSLPG